MAEVGGFLVFWEKGETRKLGWRLSECRVCFASESEDLTWIFRAQVKSCRRPGTWG